MAAATLLSVTTASLAVPITTTLGTQQTEASKKMHKRKIKKKKPFPISAWVLFETSVGVGSFVKGVQRQPLVATTLYPIITWNISKKLSLSAAMALSWYEKLDYSTPFKNSRFLPSDLYLQFSASDIFVSKKLGLHFGASFRFYFPTSPTSQFQRRVATIRPLINLTWAKGPVMLTGIVMFAKYFPLSSNPVVNCSNFSNPNQCLQGRAPETGPAGSYVSERFGGEVYIPSRGANSFYAGYGLSFAWHIWKGLSLAADLVAYQIFGVRSFPKDGLASEHARTGRAQTDRLMTDAGLTYQFNKHVGFGVNVVTDTAQPLGARGNTIVAYDLKRASDNITTLNFDLTGSF